jgi:hypothetical protein
MMRQAYNHMINRVAKMCVATMSLCMIVLILGIFFYRFMMVVPKNVLEYIIALVVVKNKARLEKCLKFFQI